MNAGERPAEDRRNALNMRAQQNSAAARLNMHFGVAAGLTAVFRGGFTGKNRVPQRQIWCVPARNRGGEKGIGTRRSLKKYSPEKGQVLKPPLMCARAWSKASNIGNIKSI